MQEVKTIFKSWRQLFPAPWPAIWLWTYLAIIILGIFTPNSQLITIIKISGIILCFLYVFNTAKTDYLLHFAMFTTSIADIILAINNIAPAGIIIFFIAQLFHLFRLHNFTHKLTIISFITLAALTITCNSIWQIIPPIFVTCFFYGITLIANVYFSYQWFKHDPKNPRACFAFWGFLLFLCCDSCTVISYFSLTSLLPAFFYGLANFFAWFFYYPSQILISNSSKYAIINPKGR